MEAIKKGDPVKVAKINDQCSVDAEGRELIGQTGIVDDVLLPHSSQPMILVRMNALAPKQPGGHHLFDFKRDELEIIPVAQPTQ
jgi:hypothetical protein